MDPRTVILGLTWISVLASMICENEAVILPSPKIGKRAAALPLKTGKDVFKEVVFTLRRMLTFTVRSNEFSVEFEQLQSLLI